VRRTEAELAKRRAYARRQREEQDAEDRRVRDWKEREEKDRRDDATPHYAVCKLGPHRFCWAAWPAGVSMIDPAVAHGYADDEPAATAAAIQAAGPGEYPAAPHPKGFARWPHEQHLLTERAAKRANGHDSAVLELLWTAHWSTSDDWLEPPSLSVQAWRVVKRTARRIYVDRERYDPLRRPSGTIWDYDVRTHVLDRAHLEREGWAERAGRWWEARRYFVRREDAVAAAGDRSARPRLGASAEAPVPECLRVLGLTPPCSRQQVERAYRRRARAAHPDAGGEHAAFLALRRAYEAALRLVPAGVA